MLNRLQPRRNPVSYNTAPSYQVIEEDVRSSWANPRQHQRQLADDPQRTMSLLFLGPAAQLVQDALHVKTRIVVHALTHRPTRHVAHFANEMRNKKCKTFWFLKNRWQSKRYEYTIWQS